MCCYLTSLEFNVITIFCHFYPLTLILSLYFAISDPMSLMLLLYFAILEPLSLMLSLHFAVSDPSEKAIQPAKLQGLEEIWIPQH